MIEIDGRSGEGGGQVLRSTLALAIATGTPVRLHHIRAGRPKPGLRPQHLAAVRAAVAVGAAEVEGMETGSTTLVFRPTGIVTGRHEIRVGTAGSATLVLQTVIPPLLAAAGPAEIVVEGGTHNPMAPPFDFLERVYLPQLARLGPTFDLRLERHGFAPEGGGRITLAIRPVPTLAPVERLARGKVVRQDARILLANLPLHIAEREARIVRRKLQWPERDVAIEIVADADGPGNAVLFEVATQAEDGSSDHQVFSAFGQLGVRAESVANRAVQAYRRWRKADAPVCEHLADQLLLPMALGGGGRFRTGVLSTHTETQIALIPRFVGCEIPVKPLGLHTFEVAVR